MATVPAPMTWQTGKVIGATQLNHEVRDSTNFMLAPPRAWIFLSVAQSIPGTSTWTALALDSRAEDTDGMVSSAAAQSDKIIIQTAGRWRLNWSIRHASIAAGTKVGGGLQKNGALIKRIIDPTINGSNQSTVQDVTYATLAVGDAMSLEAWQNSGGATDVIGQVVDDTPTPGQYVTFLQARYLGT